jgi:hypothetical protein
MPNNWVVVQVGPILQVPSRPIFGWRQEWWYIHQRSRSIDGVEHVNNAYSATAYPDRHTAWGMMILLAHRRGLGWRVVHHTDHTAHAGRREVKEVTISLHLTAEDAGLHRLSDSDLVAQAVSP